ncbi:hypothetical protein BDV26DRAFT_302216 [Aspergillus bertholletiae]|uniref:Fungal-specific transcription factor domain-containing protein n=1 Tax=Aspergillus bertholletiae TaxID=1226010 RepID=A0A5N7AQI4_9EURO|nr:hypothetical protein BDV26DRAFT_302216 [Aspergillus bertholletiae]
MFSCTQCDRSYQSQSSLARHLRNHSIRLSQHVCTACNVAFSRRDLLSRHLRIHNRASPTKRPTRATQAREKVSATGRRRCHTACEPCRKARVRCNGEHPCATCTVTQRECKYSIRSHRLRVSAVPEAAHTSPVTPSSNESHAPQLECPRPEGTPGSVDSRDEGLVSPCNVAMIAPELVSHPVSTTLNPSPNPLATLSDLGAPSDLGLLDAISWPWMYESLYLQGDPWDVFPTPVTPDFSTHTSTMPAPLSEPTLDTAPVATTMTMTTGGSREYGLAGSRSQSPSQEQLLTELTTYATQPRLEAYEARRCYWRSMSLRVAKAFGIGDWQAAHAAPTLLCMINLYRQHFGVLWPLLGPQDDDADTIHPLLFLVLASIGALYGTAAEGAFGVALHEHIRNVLLAPLFSIEEVEESLLPLGQARLLIQVAALYFGQRRAFSYAQHLGAVVITQARRMDLFSARRTAQLPTTDLSPEAQVRAWWQVEARKRLAFGILRADVFTSVLMNSRPLLSAEEIELELPAPDRLWNPTEPLPTDALARQITASASSIPHLPFCDLVRIALDRSEALLDMEPAHYELLLFGLQEPVWRFSHDPTLFLRLTGTNSLPDVTHIGHTTSDWRRPSTVPTDQLGQAHRRMQDLRDNRVQLVEALHKWNRTFNGVRATRPVEDSRTTLMSSLLLFKLSFLRLTAPLEELHSVAYALSNHKSVDNRRLCTLTLWARSPDARVAADFSSHIWHLLAQETKRSVEDRAKHNLLALAGLHHATVTLWVFAGAQAEDTLDVDLPTLGDAEEAIPLCPRESPRVVQRIINLSRLLAPMGCTSFTAAAERLSHYTFPARTSNPGGVFSFQH